MADSKAQIAELIEKASMEYVMSDSSDNSAIDSIALLFSKITSLAEQGSDTALVSSKICSLCEKITAAQPADRDVIFSVLGASIAGLQQAITAPHSAGNVIFPDELGLDASGNRLTNTLRRLYAVCQELSIDAEKCGQKELAQAADAYSGVVEALASGRKPDAGSIKNAFDCAATYLASGAKTECAEQMPAAETKPDERIPQKNESVPQVTADLSLINDFIHEASEHIDSADSKLLTIEADPSNADALNSLFRAFHTMKSLSGFLEISQVHILVKEVENLLGQARKGEIKLQGAAIETVFRATDMTRHMIDTLKKDPLNRNLVAEAHESDLIDDIRAATAGKDTVKVRTETGSASAGSVTGNATVKEIVKIDSAKLQTLIDIIGEVVIAESMVVNDESVNMLGSNKLFSNINHLNKTTKMLHELGLSLRMVPIGGTFQKMARLTRDLAKKHNKKINFTASGEETEIDRNLVDKISDPLVHMIRNAVDHGIEATAEERISAGKPEAATITLKAYHKGGSVCIEVLDDGRGLDREKIYKRALENGLISEGEIIDDGDIYPFIFKPGFSTAAVVTDTSGRGVGMDVVKKNVDLLRGSVQIETEKGYGTKFTVTLPLTTAIIEAITVSAGGEKYFLPTLSIVESVNPPASDFTLITGKGLTLNLRGSIIPVFSLERLFSRDPGSFKVDVAGKIVTVIEDSGKKTGLLLDEMLEPREIVVKNLGNGFEKIPGIAACTIMSDGRVGLILDPAEIIRLTTEKSTAKEAALAAGNKN